VALCFLNRSKKTESGEMKPNQRRRWRRVCSWLAAGVLFLGETHWASAQSPDADPKHPAAASDSKPQRPAWADIEKSVKATLAKTQGYQEGDLITREDASAVLADLKTLDWKVPEPSQLTDRLLPASDEMVRQLRGKQGVKFMREIGSVMEGYDRLDRLRKLPNGQRRLRELIHQPGGYTMIQYMATTRGGENMGRELSSKKQGDFNSATKRIYTESQLLTELKTRYQAEEANEAN
jgi:hypothetical protein